MGGRAWSASGTRRSATARQPRPEGSWSVAVARACRWWDDLTGREPGGAPYTDAAAAAILATAAVLWADAAAELATGQTPGD